MKEKNTHYLGSKLRLYKRNSYKRIIRKWVMDVPKCVLKTDLFEEAHGDDELLSLFKKSEIVIGVDYSREIFNIAKRKLNSNIKCLLSLSFEVESLYQLTFLNNLV